VKPICSAWQPFKRPIQNALDEARQVGIRVDECARIAREASAIIPASEILEACKFWRDKRPDKPFTPKTVREAVRAFMERQARLSERRKRGLNCYFGQLVEKFGNRNLHEISGDALQDFIDTKKWAAKTRNEVLGPYSLLFKDAEFRSIVPPQCNPCASIKRLKLMPGDIGILHAEQVQAILSRVKIDLIPFVSIWLFAGLRKEEVARLNWGQIRSALQTGVLEVKADQGLKTGRCSVPILPNLESWLEWYLRQNAASGLVLPLRYSKGRRLDFSLQNRGQRR
jgi:integrase